MINWPYCKALIMSHEGQRLKVYKDSEGIASIGVGFNLEDPTASTTLGALGISWQGCMSGLPLTYEQCDALFSHTLLTAANDARHFFPMLDSLPDNVAAVCLDMSFQLGRSRLGGWPNFIKQINSGNYSAAASNLATSKLASQVPNRVTENVALLNAHIAPLQPFTAPQGTSGTS